MGKLIIDGNSVFEIDEECLKKRKPPADCDIEKYLITEDTIQRESGFKREHINDQKLN